MKNRNPKLLLVLFTIIIIAICLIGNNSKKDTIINTNASSNVPTDTSQLLFIDTFINNYNENTNNKIYNCTEFIASDKSSQYYRTEFRLDAFKNAKSIHANIKNCEIDMVDYSSDLYNSNHTRFRIYLKYENINDLQEIINEIFKILDSSISDTDIQKIYTSDSFYLKPHIQGTILKNELMIDYSNYNN